MNDLTYAIQECKVVNYIDDTKIYLSNQDPQVVEVGVKKNIDMVSGECMLASPEKYQALQLGRADYNMNIECCKNVIPLSSKIKLLGFPIDK